MNTQNDFGYILKTKKFNRAIVEIMLNDPIILFFIVMPDVARFATNPSLTNEQMGSAVKEIIDHILNDYAKHDPVEFLAFSAFRGKLEERGRYPDLDSILTTAELIMRAQASSEEEAMGMRHTLNLMYNFVKHAQFYN